MPFWTKRKKEMQAQHFDKAALTMKEIMAREPVDGPNARPWRERQTAKPFPEYRSKSWDRWHITSPDNTSLITVTEEFIGVVFPDDLVIVNGEWRRVLEVSTAYEEPVIAVETTGRPI